MDVDLKKLLKNMARIVGKENAFTDKPTSLAYAKDAMPWDVEAHNIPHAVVRPASSQEVSGVLRYLGRESSSARPPKPSTAPLGRGRSEGRRGGKGGRSRWSRYD